MCSWRIALLFSSQFYRRYKNSRLFKLVKARVRVPKMVKNGYNSAFGTEALILFPFRAHALKQSLCAKS